MKPLQTPKLTSKLESGLLGLEKILLKQFCHSPPAESPPSPVIRLSPSPLLATPTAFQVQPPSKLKGAVQFVVESYKLQSKTVLQHSPK